MASKGTVKGKGQLPIKTSTQESRSILIVTAGLPRSGKSTALNNIFGTDFKDAYSASSVTRNVEVRCVGGHEDELIVVDTPGLAAEDIKINKVKNELEEAIGGLNFVLVYCLSVSPSSSINKADECVVKNLQNFLGKDIWKKCVLLLTSSDMVRHQVCPQKKDRAKYKQLLDDHAARFSQLLLKHFGPHVPKVKVISVVDSDQKENILQRMDSRQTESQSELKALRELQEIPAIPVGLQLSVGKEEHILVTGVKLNWRELAASIIIEKAPSMEREKYRFFVRDKVSTPLAASVIGATIGLAGGATMGLAVGGFGAIPGAAIGAGTGAAAGLVVGGVVGGTATGMGMLAEERIRKKRATDKVNKLKAAKHVNPKSALPILDFSESRCTSSQIKTLKLPDFKGRPRGYSELGRYQFATQSFELTEKTTKSIAISPRVEHQTIKSPESPPPDCSLTRPRAASVQHLSSSSSQDVPRECSRNPEDPDPLDPEEPDA